MADEQIDKLPKWSMKNVNLYVDALEVLRRDAKVRTPHGWRAYKAQTYVTPALHVIKMLLQELERQQDEHAVLLELRKLRKQNAKLKKLQEENKLMRQLLSEKLLEDTALSLHDREYREQVMEDIMSAWPDE